MSLRGAAMLLTALLAGGCASTYKPVNHPIELVDEQTGYRVISEARLGGFGENIVLLAFSGGGTRAAALSYGVMQELRDTTIAAAGERIRLLDEVDTISSVSGGSFTAAYYGVFGDQLFETYEQDFLRQSIQSILLQRLLSPAHWFKALFTRFDRTELAIDVYDRLVFKGATFADISLDEGPFIEINATDLAAGQRFSFTQERFDLLCSDLSRFSIARAVTASSAVPVAFSTVVLENHADRCDITQTREWRLLNSLSVTDDQPESEYQQEFVDSLKTYRDVDKRAYIHLVDGGISDNLGLRAAIERMDTIGNEVFQDPDVPPPRNVLVILVNAEVKPELVIEKTASKPSIGATVSAFSGAQISRYTAETRATMQRKAAEMQATAQRNGWPTRVFFAEVSFDDVLNREASQLLNSLPTSLELSNDQIDALIASGRILLRQEPEFQRFLSKSQGRLSAGAISEQELCKFFAHELCR
jgi:NTE family protein